MQRYFVICLWLICYAAQGAVNQPFRVGVWSLNKLANKVKPLAVADMGGWVAADDIIYGGYDGHWLVAYSLKSHRVLWSTSIDGEVTAPPLLVENQKLVVATRSGHLLLLKSATGEIEWNIALDSYVSRAMLSANGKLFAVSVGQVIHAIELSSGKRNWIYDAGFPEGVTLLRGAAPVIYEQRMLVGLASGEVLGLSLDQGKLIWKYNPLYIDSRFHDVVGDLAAFNGRLLISRHDGLVGLIDIASNERRLIWNERVAPISASTLRGGRYFVACINGDLISYDAQTGRQLWKINIGSNAPSQLFVTESNAYAIGTGGRIVALDVKSGEIQWFDELAGRVVTPPIIFQDKMLVATGLKNLYGYMIQ